MQVKSTPVTDLLFGEKRLRNTPQSSLLVEIGLQHRVFQKLFYIPHVENSDEYERRKIEEFY